MTLYGQVKNGAIISEGPQPLPTSFLLESGGEVTAFDKVEKPNDYGWYEWIVEAQPTFDPVSQHITSENVFANNKIRTVYTAVNNTTDDVSTNTQTFKASLLKTLDDLTNVKMEAGYPHNFGGVVGVKILQTRQTPPNDDRPNWLALMATAHSMITVFNNPGGSCGGIRTADNTVVPVTALQALQAMLGMQAYLSPILAYSWALKDSIKNKTTIEELRAVNINMGWPG